MSLLEHSPLQLGIERLGNKQSECVACGARSPKSTGRAAFCCKDSEEGVVLVPELSEKTGLPCKDRDASMISGLGKRLALPL